MPRLDENTAVLRPHVIATYSSQCTAHQPDTRFLCVRRDFAAPVWLPVVAPTDPFPPWSCYCAQAVAAGHSRAKQLWPLHMHPTTTMCAHTWLPTTLKVLTPAQRYVPRASMKTVFIQ